jgi:accessory gene regulator B
MLNKMAKKLSNRLLKNEVITEDVIDVYVYGFELIISSLVNTLVIILAGSLLGEIVQTMSFLFVFILLRSFTGGYHANTYTKCSIVTFSTYVTVLLLSHYINIPKFAYMILLILGVIILAIFAPIKNPNKQLTELKIRIFKILSLFIFIMFITVGILLIDWNSSISNVIYFALISVLFLLFIKEKKERRTQNEGI